MTKSQLKKQAGVHLSGVLIKWRQKGDVLNTHESFVQVRDELLDVLDELGVFEPQKVCERKHVKESKLKGTRYAVRHAGQIIGRVGFKTIEEARSWAEWNYKGKGEWEVVATT